MSRDGYVLSPWRVTLAVVVGLAVVAGAVLGGAWWKARAEGTGVTSWFAPYVDTTATPEYAFEDLSGAGSKESVLAFVTAPKDGGCTPSWGGAYSLDEASTALDLDRRIDRLREQGGDVAVSFGGQAGTELGLACDSADALRSAYSSVVTRYDVTTIDLDLEGGALSDTASIARRADAVAALQDARAKAGHPLAVWLTLPVGTDGLQADAEAVVTAMIKGGVDLAGVNAMTMDYGVKLPSGESMAKAAETALSDVHTQLGALYSAQGQHFSSEQLWGKMGATPMIGQNDTTSEVFGLTDARQLNAFAVKNGLGRLSMWSANRDQSCSANYADTSVVSDECSGVKQGGASFAGLLGKGYHGTIAEAAHATVTPTATPVATDAGQTDDPATSPYQIWDAKGAYAMGTKVVWHHEVYEAKWWTQGDVPDDPTAKSWETPWTLVGPVLPGETPAPVPTVAPGTFPEWSASTAYRAGDRIMFDGVAYQAKWWTQGDDPSHQTADPSEPSPWSPLTAQQVAALTGD